MPPSRFSTALLLLICTLTTTHLNAKNITADGIGYSRDMAIRNALRGAVEQGVGSFLSSETVIKNYMTISDRILTHTDGYVKSYDVVSEGTEFGMVKVRISAQVESGQLQKDLVAHRLLYEIKNKPRIMVLLDERMDDRELSEKTATAKFEELLLQKGFKVIEPEQFKTVQNAEKIKGMNDADVAGLAFRDGADLLIKGGISVAKATPKMIYGTQFYSVPIQMNVHIVKADNGQIIATRTKTIKKNSQEEFSAAQFGLTVGGQTLAEELFSDLMNFWQSESYNQNNVELTVTGMDAVSLSAAEKIIMSMPLVSAVHLRYIEGKSALYDLEIRGTVQDLREAVTQQAGLGLSVTALTANRLTLSSHKTGAPVRFEYTPPSLDITRFALQDIFPARLRYYEDHPLASVTMTAGSVPIDRVKVSVFIPGLMDLPAECTVISLVPGETREVPVAVVLKGAGALAGSDTRTVTGQVKLSFESKGQRVERTLTAPVKIMDKNTIDWAKPSSIGGFVAYRDATVNALARKAVLQISDNEVANKDLLQALAIFQALKELGIKYVKDPSGSPGAGVLDRVQYPFETLSALSGDCDDLSTVFAAMLSAVGIECAIIMYSDHVLVMFNTGVFEKNRFTLSADPTMTVAHNGTLWIPVETTIIGKGFIAAWKTAAVEFHQAVSEGQSVSIIDLAGAWKEFPPSAPDNTLKQFDLPLLANAVKIEAKSLRETAGASVQVALELARAGQSDEPLEQTRLGLLQVRSGDYRGAVVSFGKVAKKNTGIAAAVNHASAILLSGDENKAIDLLNVVYKDDRTGKAAINRALALYVKAQSDGDIESFITALKVARSIMPTAADLGAYLGIDLGDEDNVRGAQNIQTSARQTIDRRRLRELVRQRVLKNAVKMSAAAGERLQSTTAFGGIRGADPTQVAQIVELLCWFETL